MATFAYDVFISYSHDDEAWVTGTLLPRLEEAELRVCIDYRDFQVGVPSLINMQNAVQNSCHTLLVMTPAWVASQWTLYETLLTRTDDPAGLRRRTVPLLLQPCEIPAFISMLTYVDFTRPDRREVAWRQLITTLGAPPDLAERAAETPGPDAAQVSAWRRMLDNHRQSLRLIEERMSEYVEPTDVPLQLVRSKQRLEAQIAELEHKLGESTKDG